jgi:transketolase
MRREFADELVKVARSDSRVVLLTADLGFAVLEPFAKEFPERFFNVGVAEQNMIGLATGLAEAGLRPYAYSIATFASMRPYEFFRNGPALHGLPVRLIGMGGGLDYGHNGMTHYALEDVALMRVQPAVTIVAPADAEQARAALRATVDLPGPVYFRLCKQSTSVPGLDGSFDLGRASVLRSGTDIAIVALGNLAFEAVEAAGLLAEAGLSVAVVVVSCLNPSPVDDLADVLSQVPVAITAEAHYPNGGLGSLVCEVVAEHGLQCRVVRCAVNGPLQGITGSSDYLYEETGLTADHIAGVGIQTLAAVA